jgi:hypothetical protein
MYLTDYHAKYFAHELTKRCPSDSLEKLVGALVADFSDLFVWLVFMRLSRLPPVKVL